MLPAANVTMGCCGSRVDVRELQRPVESSDDESVVGDQEDVSSEAMIQLKAEARRIFAMGDDGALPSLDCHPSLAVSQRAELKATQLVGLSRTDASGQLDRAELRKLVDLMSKQLSRTRPCSSHAGAALLNPCGGLCTCWGDCQMQSTTKDQ